MLIVFAHPLEAQLALYELQAKEVEPGRLWKIEQGAILVTGMGAVAAAATVGRYAPGFSHILNIGFAGSLGEEKIGSVIEVGQCTKHISIPSSAPEHCTKVASRAYPPLTIGSGASLLSSDYPIYSAAERKELSQHHLVDMEGYGIALAAKRADLPCTMWKVVSDSCQGKGWNTITENLGALQEKVTCHLLKQIDLTKIDLSR